MGFLLWCQTCWGSAGKMMGTGRREKDLNAWEAELKRREQDIKRREDAVTRAGIPVNDKNWPPFFPIIHHDIANEIPAHAQRLQYLAFASWLGIVFCLVFNIVAARLKEELHIGFCIIATIAPPIVFHGKSLTGVLAAIDVFSDSVLVGIFYIIGTGFFCLETLLSLWVLQKIYMYFRGQK